MNPSTSKSRYYLRQAVELACVLLVVFAIRSSIVEPFKIPSGSMIPTLYVGDFILVNKFAYGFHIPLLDYFGVKKNLVDRAPPKRGEIIVFRYPRDPSQHYIKRVIGVPGDRIELRNKIVYVNGKALAETVVDPRFQTEKLKDIGDGQYGDNHMKMSLERVDGKDHLMMTDSENATTREFGPIVVPADRLFVMGDNRDFSSDSRYWGFVPYENITGRAEAIWLSLWVNVANASENAFHPSRIGTRLN
jgi:signal peptidase I